MNHWMFSCRLNRSSNQTYRSRTWIGDAQTMTRVRFRSGNFIVKLTTSAEPKQTTIDMISNLNCLSVQVIVNEERPRTRIRIPNANANVTENESFMQMTIGPERHRERQPASKREIDRKALIKHSAWIWSWFVLLSLFSRQSLRFRTIIYGCN